MTIKTIMRVTERPVNRLNRSSARYDRRVVSPLPSWVSEDETKPAPMPLLLVQSFVNTWEADSATDLLGDVDTARVWLAGAGLLLGTLGEADLAEARAVRESIRAVLVQNGGGPPVAAPELEALVAAAGHWRLTPMVEPGGRVRLRPLGEGPVDVGRLLLVVRDAQKDGSFDRLKACRNDECRWAFFDRSHARRGAWCDMAVCGNRIKNRNLRSRRSGAAGGVAS